jgi:hypothetical protein
LQELRITFLASPIKNAEFHHKIMDYQRSDPELVTSRIGRAARNRPIEKDQTPFPDICRSVTVGDSGLELLRGAAREGRQRHGMNCRTG